MGVVTAHTHDDVDWAERLPTLRRANALDAGTLAEVAARLTGDLPENATVADIGCGAGGMSAAMATALSRHAGGTLILVDAVPELLAAATEAAATAATAAGGRDVRVDTVHADVAAGNLSALIP